MIPCHVARISLRRCRQPAASRTARPSSRARGDLYDPKSLRNSGGGRNARSSGPSGTSSGSPARQAKATIPSIAITIGPMTRGTASGRTIGSNLLQGCLSRSGPSTNADGIIARPAPRGQQPERRKREDVGRGPGGKSWGRFARFPGRSRHPTAGAVPWDAEAGPMATGVETEPNTPGPLAGRHFWTAR